MADGNDYSSGVGEMTSDISPRRARKQSGIFEAELQTQVAKRRAKEAKLSSRLAQRAYRDAKIRQRIEKQREELELAQEGLKRSVWTGRVVPVRGSRRARAHSRRLARNRGFF